MSPAAHCCACCPPTKAARCRSIWSIPEDDIRRRSCARSSTSARPACAVAAPLWSERSIPDCVELLRGTLIFCRPDLSQRISAFAGSPILPDRCALFHERGDSFLGVTRHHVLEHDFVGVVVGMDDVHFELAIERLLAEPDDRRRFGGDLAREL